MTGEGAAAAELGYQVPGIQGAWRGGNREIPETLPGSVRPCVDRIFARLPSVDDTRRYGTARRGFSGQKKCEKICGAGTPRRPGRVMAAHYRPDVRVRGMRGGLLECGFAPRAGGGGALLAAREGARRVEIPVEFPKISTERRDTSASQRYICGGAWKGAPGDGEVQGRKGEKKLVGKS